jgi:hypothetical protein
MYLSYEEAEELKSAYASWVGKRAHVGKGQTETLVAIKIIPKNEDSVFKDPEKNFYLEFEFEGHKKFSSTEFLFHNSQNYFKFRKRGKVK